MTTTIVVTAYGRADLTARCLASLEEHSPGVPVLVVDNGSLDDTPDVIAGVDHVTIYPNVGFAAATNLGVFRANTEYVTLLNNDTEVHAGWLDPHLEQLDRDPNTVMVGSFLTFPDETVQHAGVYFEQQGDVLAGIHHMEQRPSGPMPAVTAACVTVRRDSFLDGGGFDVRFDNGNEDCDLCFKLRDAGWTIWYAAGSHVTHVESASGPSRWRSVRHNVRLLTERWLGRPDLWKQ